MKELIFFASIILMIISIIQLRKLSKYEFDNMTDGGVIKFESYGASTNHNLKKLLFRFLIVSSIMAALFFGILVLAD